MGFYITAGWHQYISVAVGAIIQNTADHFAAKENVNMFVNTTYRSTEEEIMDDLSMEGEMLRQTLDKLAQINQRLGGNQATISGLHTLLKTSSKDTVINIVDIGCGSGDMLRAVADYGR